MRLPGRELVTIAAGFHCADGILLCGDTQETTDDLTKRSHPKLDIRPDYIAAHDTMPRAVFAGAGDSDYMDYLVKELWRVMQKCATVRAMIGAAKKELVRICTDVAACYHPGCGPQAKLLIGLWSTPDQIELVKTGGSLLVRHVRVEALGRGNIAANYFMNRVVNAKTAFDHAVPIGLYMIDEAKENIPGCGGNTRLVTLANDGAVTVYRQDIIKSMTKDLRQIDLIARELVALGAEDVASETFDSALKNYKWKI